MDHQILWDNLETAGSEYVNLRKWDTHYEAKGTVLFVQHQNPYHVRYELKLGRDWKTKTVRLYVGNEDQPFVLQAKEQDKWWVDGEYEEDLDGATNVDLSLTPFSNTLPINRFSWDIGQRRTFKMVFIDVLKKEVQPLQQVYTYLGDNDGDRIFQYKCREFETAIVVDEHGLVVEYPGVFVRRSIRITEGGGDGQQLPLDRQNTSASHFY